MTGRALVELDDAWAAAAAANDLNAALEFWTDDAVMYLPGLPPVHGKHALRKLHESRGSQPGCRISWTPSCAGLDGHSSMAYTLGGGTVSLVDETGAPRDHQARYVAIWRRENGRWRCAVKCWTPSP